MLRPEMKPVDPGTPGVGRPSKPKPKPEESKPSVVPGGGRPGHPEPAPGPSAFDAGPSPYLTHEITHHAAPPLTKEEAERREKRKERAKIRWEKARKRASAAQTPPEVSQVEDIPDISETEVFDVCGEFCQQNPQAMTAVMNLIEGFDPDDDEQTLEQRVSHHLRIMGLNDAFGHGDWYTTRLDPSVEHTATRIVDYYFDRVEASRAAVAAMPVTQAEPTVAQGQGYAGIGGSEQPEISVLLQWGLAEAFPGEWDPRWSTRQELQDFLVSDLKRNIQGYDETARVVPGFDGTVINWADLDVEEMMALYRVEIALELAARAEHFEGFPPEYEEIKASLDRATELESLAGPIPLDDTEAYAAAFGIADAEVQRKHVQDQLAVIYKHLNIEMPENHLENRSTTELKYELYYRLNYDVPQFTGLDENEKENRIGKFLREYHEEAQLRPEDVIDRLQGTFRQPDVLGFLFIMGLSIAFEPVDYALTAVDVIQALSEGDTESAIGNFILGVTPFVSSKLDDLILSLLRPIDNVRLPHTRIGNTLLARDELRRLEFSDEMIEIFEHSGGTGPGIGASTHTELMGIRQINGWALTKGEGKTGIYKQNYNFLALRDRYGYNIVNEPIEGQLKHRHIQYHKRTFASGRPIDSGNKHPDYIIEGRVFDAYTVGGPNDIASGENAIGRIWNALTRKVPSQADRLVIDLSYTDLTADELKKYLSDVYATGDPNIADLKEVFVMKDYTLSGIWVQPKV